MHFLQQVIENFEVDDTVGGDDRIFNVDQFSLLVVRDQVKFQVKFHTNFED